MDINVGAATGETVSAAVLLTPPIDAVIVAEPAAIVVANPVELIFTTAALDDVQVAAEVTFAVVPLLYVAVAVNCCAAPAVTVAVLGDIARDVTVGAVTKRTAVPLAPLNDAVTVVEPVANPVAIPFGFIVAVAALEVAQVAVDVTSVDELSL